MAIDLSKRANTKLAGAVPGEWKHDMLLSVTILPWIAEWLIHYELWLITGHWTGGGHTLTGSRAVAPSSRDA